MKEVAEQLLTIMRLCVEKKKSGQAGNYQGVLNQTRQIFDTTVKLWAGRHPELMPLCSEAQRIQMEGARIPAGRGKASSGSQTAKSTPIDMAAAFDFQKKRAISRTNVVVSKPAVIEPKAKQFKPTPPVQPIPEPEVSAAELPPIEEETVRFLLNLSPAKFRDRFGGVDGLAAFGRETFHIDFDLEADDYAKMVKVLKQELSAMLPND